MTEQFEGTCDFCNCNRNDLSYVNKIENGELIMHVEMCSQCFETMSSRDDEDYDVYGDDCFYKKNRQNIIKVMEIRAQAFVQELLEEYNIDGEVDVELHDRK